MKLRVIGRVAMERLRGARSALTGLWDRGIHVAGRSRAEVERLNGELLRSQQRAWRAERRLRVARQEADLLRDALSESVRDRTEAEVDEGAARRDGDLPPSFRYKLGEQRRVARLLAERHGVLEPVAEIDDKYAGSRFAASVGVAVPKVFVQPRSLADVDFGQLPDEFVLKPTDGHSGRGVFPLVRVADDGYRSLLDRSATFTEAEIRRHCEDSDVAGRLFLVEELMAEHGGDGPQLPVEWRFFCFGGTVRLIMGRAGDGYRSLRRQRFRYFDRNWSDLGIVRLENKHDPAIEVPTRSGEAVGTAETLATAIPRAMLRIDLHVLERGVFFGEVTPEPGGLWALLDELDRRLGGYWEAAEADLLATGITRGTFDLRAGTDV